MGELANQTLAYLDGKAGLADTTGAGQCQKSRHPEPFDQARKLQFTTDEAVDARRQIVER